MQLLRIPICVMKVKSGLIAIGAFVFVAESAELNPSQVKSVITSWVGCQQIGEQIQHEVEAVTCEEFP